MSEHEKIMQVGRLTEEYSRVKGELNHIEERLRLSQLGAQFYSATMPNLLLTGEDLSPNPNQGRHYNGSPNDMRGMLSYTEAVEAFRERERLRGVVAEVGKRLNSLAPNVTGVMY